VQCKDQPTPSLVRFDILDSWPVTISTKDGASLVIVFRTRVAEWLQMDARRLGFSEGALAIAFPVFLPPPLRGGCAPARKQGFLSAARLPMREPAEDREIQSA
jgi:hypothetical protein